MRLTDSKLDGAAMDEEVVEDPLALPFELNPVVLAEAKSKLSRSASIKTAIHKSFLRGCIVELGLERETLMKENDVEWLMPEVNITTALEALFDAQDASADTKSEEEVVENLGLSLSAVESFCEAQLGEPLADVVLNCMKDLAERNRTRRRAWYFVFGEGRGEKDVEHPSPELSGWLEERVQVNHSLSLVRLSSGSFFTAAPKAGEFKSELEKLLADNKVRIKATGYSVTHSLAYCKRINKDETAGEDEKYVERVSQEMMTPEIKSGDCQEVGNTTCPEGTSPDHTRNWKWGRAAQVWVVGFALGAPICWVGGGVVGLLMGKFWAGLSYGFVLGVVPGFTHVLPLPFAALAAVPFIGDCGCNVNPCEWNEEHRLCTLTPSDTNSNEFQWLPYPGTKCVPAADFDEARPECRMDVCSVEDFQPQHQGLQGSTSLFGKLGVDTETGDSTGAMGAYNCLSKDGDRTGALWRKEFWVDVGTPGEVPNTPENRNKVYSDLNVIAPWNVSQ